MSRYTGPKAKRCRRHGMNLYGSDKYDRILQHKPHMPGKTPRGRVGRKTDYAKQLLEKQRARDIYCLSEKQFRGLVKEASKTSGKTGDVLKQILERRVDNVLYRAGFALTRLQARQFAGHGLFLVNGVRIRVPSYRMSSGDVISVRSKSKDAPVFPPIFVLHEKYAPPKWMNVDAKNMRIEIVELPGPDDAEQAVDVQRVIEFYSRV